MAFRPLRCVAGISRFLPVGGRSSFQRGPLRQLALVCLPLLTLSGHAAGQAQTETLLGDRLGPGQSVGTWGEGSSATVSDDGVWQLTLDGGVRPAGAFYQLGRSLDLASAHDRLYLAFDIKGAKGGETIRVTLRDRSAAGGTDGYQVEAEQPAGFLVTTSWQRLVLPLTDFPTTGENWSLPVPAGERRPLRRKIDWSMIDTLGIGKWAGSMTVFLKHIAISTNPEADAVRLIMPPSVPVAMDFCAPMQRY